MDTFACFINTYFVYMFYLFNILVSPTFSSSVSSFWPLTGHNLSLRKVMATPQHTQSWVDKGVNTFLKGINLKVNAVMWLEFELAYRNVKVLHISHYTMRTSLYFWESIKCYILQNNNCFHLYNFISYRF